MGRSALAVGKLMLEVIDMVNTSGTPPPATNSSHLKIVTWKTIVSCWNGLFSSAMFILGGVENLWHLLKHVILTPKRLKWRKFILIPWFVGYHSSQVSWYVSMNGKTPSCWVFKYIHSFNFPWNSHIKAKALSSRESINRPSSKTESKVSQS